MRRHLWLSMIGLLILALGVFPFSSQATIERSKGMPPPPPFRMVFQGFTNESSMWLVIRQGETGMLRILFTRQYTNETLSMRLWLDSDGGNLPEGISYAINPYLLELSTDADYSVNLTIVASPNARVGNFTIGLGGSYYRVGVDDYNSQFGQRFTLELGQSVPATGGIDFGLLAIIGVVLAAIALIGLTVVEYRRKKLSKTSQRPPQQTSPSSRLEFSETQDLPAQPLRTCLKPSCPFD